MLQTIIAVLVLSVGVIALSRLTVLYYTKKKIEESKEGLKPSERVKQMDKNEKLLKQYQKYQRFVKYIESRVRFEFNQESITISNTHSIEGLSPWGTRFNAVTQSIEIRHDGWIVKAISDELSLLYYNKIKLDADWLVDNEVAHDEFGPELEEVLRILEEKGYGE